MGRALIVGYSIILSTGLNAEVNSPSKLGVLSQAASLPDGFQEHFFDVPLAVRIDVNAQLLGDALVVLGRDETIRLLSFTDTQQSALPEAERAQWLDQLSTPVALGSCTDNCANGLVALHYNLQDSQLSILTDDAEQQGDAAQYHSLPEGGSAGLILQNQLNIAHGGGSEASTAARYNVQASSSIGNWTQVASAELARTGEPDSPTYHSLNQLYGQREFAGNFFRLGYFTPDALGVYRRPRNFGASPDTTLGFMYGTSDSLAVNSASPSTYPVYVTPSRQGLVEVYRDGVLIYSQAVASGLQTLDTRRLPGGIYPVQVRLIEDGQVTSTTEEVIYKPNNWRNADQPWRYSVFGGKRRQLFNNWGDDVQYDQGLTYGVLLNYLVHPRVILGADAQRVAQKMQYGGSIDWSLSDKISLYSNVYQTSGYGTGMDVQARYQYRSGSVMFSHSRSWLDTRNDIDYLDTIAIRPKTRYNGRTQNTALSVTQRLNLTSSLTGRVSHSSGNTNGTGVDLSWLRRSTLFGSDVNWQVSVFDRPASISTGSQRNRGIDLSINLALGNPGGNFSASIGSRTSRDGERELNGSLGYNKTLDGDFFKSYSTSLTADSYGAGLNGATQFETRVLNGDAYAQRSSYDGEVSGGLNLSSTVAVGAGTMAASGNFYGDDGAMIVDLDSDIDNLVLRADDMSGSYGAELKPGRNIVPVGAYKSGTVHFDFNGSDAYAASIQPPQARYHLNKGGVMYQKVRVLKTLSVLGRLVDPQGRPMAGAHILNHASSGVTEADGFFVLEMSEASPSLEINHRGQPACSVVLEPGKHKRENNVLLVADIVCHPTSVGVAKGP